MTRKEYLHSLSEALSFLNDETRAAAMGFYTEMLDDRMEDGMDETAAVAAMESPDAIAQRLKAEGIPGGTAKDDEEVTVLLKDTMDSAEYIFQTAKSQVQQAVEQIQAAQSTMEQEAHRPEADNHSGYEQRVLSHPAADLHAVHIEAMDMPIKIYPSDDDQISLTYYSCKRDEYRAQMENGVLRLEHVGKENIHTGFRISLFGLKGIFDGNGMRVLWNQSMPIIELAVPAGALVDLHAETGNGSIRVQGLNALCDTHLSTSNSRIAVENVTAKALEMKTSNARIVLKDVSVKQSLLGKTSNARVEGVNILSGEETELITSNGRISMERVVSRKKIILTTSNSSMNVGNLSAQAIQLRTTNGNIHGVLPGSARDWEITSGTSNGRNSLPQYQAGEKPLSVHTSNGNINLAFES